MSALARFASTPAAPARAPWSALIEGLAECVWLVHEAPLRVVAVNAAALRLLGRAREEVVGTGPLSLLATPEDAVFWDEVQADGAAARGLDSQAVLARADGSLAYLGRRISRLPDGLWLVAVQDHTAEREREDQRETLLAELRATLESTADGILVTDLSGRIRAFNRRFADLWHLPQDLLTGGRDEAVFDWIRRSVVDPAAYQRGLDALADAALQQSTERLTLHSGEVIERVTLPQWSRGRPVGRVWSFRDLTERLAADRRIELLSTTDTLTGLPNRTTLHERLRTALARCGPARQGLAVMLLDLDRFKQVNDSLGREAADRVLAELGRRLQAALRDGDAVARVGGDQFALVLHETDLRGAEAAARRLLDAVARPFLAEAQAADGAAEGSAFTVTASLGIALHPQDGSRADELICRAETAMQQAKAGGRAGFRFHRAQRRDGERGARMRLEQAMRQALVGGRFRLAYQPQLALDDGAVLGAEALLRWHDPARGDVPPGEFIPVAEESGFIVPLGDWVLEEAVRQAARWQAQGRGLRVAVNVSALQFQQANFVDRVATVLREAGLPASLLELELTESILVRDAEEALARLSALAGLGVKLAIDDFGTGYSSLAYLKRFPIHRLKIDRSFVRGLPADASDAAIVRAMIQMGTALGLRVIAEGVETEPQRRFLAEAGCHEFQGFLFSPALAPAALLDRLSSA